MRTKCKPKSGSVQGFPAATAEMSRRHGMLGKEAFCLTVETHYHSSGIYRAGYGNVAYIALNKCSHSVVGLVVKSLNPEEGPP